MLIEILWVVESSSSAPNNDEYNTNVHSLCAELRGICLTDSGCFSL